MNVIGILKNKKKKTILVSCNQPVVYQWDLYLYTTLEICSILIGIEKKIFVL